MLLNVLKRALFLFLVLIGISTAAIGGIIWYHIRIANPCSASDLLNSEPITCVYRVQHIVDWPTTLSTLAIGFVICLLASWLSYKFGRASNED